MYTFIFCFYFYWSVRILLSRGFSLHIQLKREGKKLLELKKYICIGICILSEGNVKKNKGN